MKPNCCSAGAGGTASSADYTGVSNGQVKILQGQTSARFTVSTLTDSVTDDAETFTVTIAGSAPGYRIADAVATGTIQEAVCTNDTNSLNLVRTTPAEFQSPGYELSMYQLDTRRYTVWLNRQPCDGVAIAIRGTSRYWSQEEY